MTSTTPFRPIGQAFLIATIALFALADGSSGATLPMDGAFQEYSLGHADIGILYDDVDLLLHWHFGGGTVIDGTPLPSAIPPAPTVRYEWSPTSAYARVPDSAIVPTSVVSGLPASYDFVGHNGTQFWNLSHNNLGTQPFLGVATESVGGDAFNPASALWPDGFLYELIDNDGPGEVSLWSTGVFGGTTPLFSTVDGIDPLDDRFEIPAGTHAHYNWGFTEAGIYGVTLRASATHRDAGYLEDTATFYFVVGDNVNFALQSVPEPGTWLVITSGLLGFSVLSRRRRYQSGR